MYCSLNFKTLFANKQNLSVFHLISIFFLSIFLLLSVCGNSIQAKTDTKSQTYKNLMGVGINSMKEWSGCNNWDKHHSVIGSVEEYSQVLSDGWRHLNFFICAQEHFPNDELDQNLVRLKLESIRSQISQLKTKFPDRTFVIVFKGYDYVEKGIGFSGTVLYQRIIKSKRMEAEFIKWWKLAAEIFENEKSVAFWLMNEPDYRYLDGLKDYVQLMTKTVDEIRKVAPKRWIILNGTHGSVIGREKLNKTIFDIMQPISRANIVYGFHSYGTSKSKWHRFEYANSNAISSISQWDNEIKKGLGEAIRFKKRYNVPVMLSEVGIIAKTKYVNKGVDSKERARFFREVIIPWSDKCDCGISYWGLGDDSTPYVRQRFKSLGAPEYARGTSKGADPRPPKGIPLIRDEDLLEALGLTEYFAFKTEKVKELQTLLDTSGYNVGKIDGILGKKTLDALVSWYKDKKIRFNKKTSNKLEYLIALKNIKENFR